jgi:hypothetical protein
MLSLFLSEWKINITSQRNIYFRMVHLFWDVMLWRWVKRCDVSKEYNAFTYVV